ncbi:dihydrofolate reductase family protein [Actinoplanes sp. GCM10030250]|uniref:dihydrofolate reductase family protein n=1 Tax=Actinoplanes sp. GCM10030250 TaxID=3273376 RepID=UPI00361CFC83
MAKLIYSMIMSVDGFVSDRDGNFGWGAPEEESHRFMNDRMREFGTYLYGRKMYEVMSYWETADALPDQPDFMVDCARIWQAADKVVYSTTLDEVTTGRTRLERTFDPEAIRKLKAESDRDLTVDGPDLASQAIRAGLVDEFQLIIGPAIVGGGHRFFASDIRADLNLLDMRRFDNGVAFLRYAVAP